MKLVLSCEHGGNSIPEHYASLFAEHKELLNSHLGYDPGTYDLFEALQPLASFSKCNTISRLLIECNRSLHHPKLFSEQSKRLSPAEKQRLITSVYRPYRQAIEEQIREMLARDQKVLHVSLHSFTPSLNSEVRSNHIGLLYDPKRRLEKDISARFRRRIRSLDPTLKVRANYPYLGIADGFTTYLRRQFPSNYAGIELELNQGLVENEAFPVLLKKNIKLVVSELLQS